MVDAPRPAVAGTRPRRRSRRRVALAIVLIIPLGMLVRQLPGEVGDLLAGACFPVLFALIIWLVAPRLSAPVCAAGAFVIAASIEAAQLTPIPALVSGAFPPAYWLLGTTFAPLDLAGYAVGALLILGASPALTDRVPLVPAARPPATPNGRGQ